MSKRYSRVEKSVLLTLVITVIGVGPVFYLLMKHKSESRRLSETRKLIQQSLPYAVVKRSMYFGTKIDVIEQKENEVTLKGAIVAYRAYNENIDFRWHLPEGAGIVSGAEAGSISGLGYLQSHEFEITVDHLSPSENQNIILTAELAEQGQKIGNQAIFSTHIEKTEEGRNIGLFEKLSLESIPSEDHPQAESDSESHERLKSKTSRVISSESTSGEVQKKVHIEKSNPRKVIH